MAPHPIPGPRQSWRSGQPTSELIREEVHVHFGLHQHTQLWKKLDAKNPNHNYCIEFSGQWFWNGNWVKVVHQEFERPDTCFPSRGSRVRLSSPAPTSA